MNTPAVTPEQVHEIKLERGVLWVLIEDLPESPEREELL